MTALVLLQASVVILLVVTARLHRRIARLEAAHAALLASRAGELILPLGFVAQIEANLERLLSPRPPQ